MEVFLDVMDGVKEEPDVDPLAPENYGNEEEKSPMPMEGSAMKVEIEIKEEPSDVVDDLVSDIKYEDDVDPIAFPVTKFEAEDESWNVDETKEELLPDVKIEDVDLTDRLMQQDCQDDVRSNETVTREKSLQHSCVVMHTQTLKNLIFLNSESEANISPQNDSSRIYVAKVITDPPIKKIDGQQTFICNFCDRTFTRLDSLRIHERTHTGDKPFECIYCGRGFKKRQHLRNHTLIHTGLKPFKCDICERSFARIHSLRYHTLTHARFKIFKCQICEKTFQRHHSFRKHLSTHTDAKNSSSNL